jgi:hypothetical protein
VSSVIALAAAEPPLAAANAGVLNVSVASKVCVEIAVSGVAGMVPL